MANNEFTEKDAVDGKNLKDTILELLKKQNLILTEKHEGLQSSVLPSVESIFEENDIFKLEIQHEDKSYDVDVLQTLSGVLRSGLCWMYGSGLVKYDYELPIFQGLKKDVIDRYKKFAVQIWERNIHRDWMQKERGYIYHNGDYSKGPDFLYGVSSADRKEIMAAVEMHRRITDAEEGDETPHHFIKTKEDLRMVLMDRGKDDKLKELLIESIYDQTTATTRMHYPNRDKKSFEERLTENMNAGYFCDDFRWTPGSLNDPDIDCEYEKEIWGIWLKAHEEFKEYWIKKFGEKEQFWQPPRDSPKY